VNEEDRAFTRELSKIAKNFDNVSLVSIEFHKHLFTCHGLQMNIKGKEAIAKRLLAVLLAIVGKHIVSDPICLACLDIHVFCMKKIQHR
jgi:hypothetical protein